MGDDLRLKERQCARTPMQWSSEPQGGFSRNPKCVVKVISGGAYGYQRINVADQRRDPNSLLNWMERIIRMRKEVPEIGWGDFEVLPTRKADVLAIRYDWSGRSVVVVHNLNSNPCKVVLNVGIHTDGDVELVNLLSDDHSRPDESGSHAVELEPYGYRWYRVGGLQDQNK
jgi:maltose alpha-D-glucosyltransferase/alpha-amylase